MRGFLIDKQAEPEGSAAYGKDKNRGKECCPLPSLMSYDDVVFFEVEKDCLAALCEEDDAAALRIDVARHRALAAVQEHLAARYVEEDAHRNAAVLVVHPDAANACVALLDVAGDVDAHAGAVEHHLVARAVIVDACVVRAVAEHFDAGALRRAELEREAKLDAGALDVGEGDLSRKGNTVRLYFSPAVALDLADGCLIELAVLQGEFARQYHAAHPAVLCGGRGARPHLHPGDHDGASVGR